jgi:hypothetical protein
MIAPTAPIKPRALLGRGKLAQPDCGIVHRYRRSTDQQEATKKRPRAAPGVQRAQRAFYASSQATQRASACRLSSSTRPERRSASTSSRLNTLHSRRNLPTKSPRSHHSRHSHHSLRNRASSLYSRGRDRGRRDRGRRGRDRRSLRSRSRRRDRGRRDRGRRHGQQVVCPARMFWGFLCRRHRTSPD